MARSDADKVLRFPGLPSDDYLRWVAQEEVSRGQRLAAEREYVKLCMGWKTGRFLYGLARQGHLGPYAVVFTGTEDPAQECVAPVLESTRYVPHVQPRTPQEAIAAIRAEEAREVANFGEPDNYRCMLYVIDGDPRKMAILAEQADLAARRQLAIWDLLLKRYSITKRLWPVWLWRRRQLMRRTWTA